MQTNRSLRYIAGAFSVGALVLLSAMATHTGTAESVQAKGNPNGNATASTKAPLMQFGQTAGEEPTTTTLPGR